MWLDKPRLRWSGNRLHCNVLTRPLGPGERFDPVRFDFLVRGSFPDLDVFFKDLQRLGRGRLRLRLRYPTTCEQQHNAHRETKCSSHRVQIGRASSRERMKM